MSFSPAFLDELRSRVGLVSVVQRRVKLTKAGHEWKGCCPFHNEKTPSFYVNEPKHMLHCFGCGWHGDVIKFVMEQEGLRFREAVTNLAAECGLEVPDETPEQRARDERRAGLVDVMAEAARWYAGQLQGLAGAEARRYVADRGLTAETIERFGLGFAPTGNKLAGALSSIEPEKLIECGLLGEAEGRGRYDRFRGRLMFPIRDPRGRVVGFGARAIGDAQPKYLNSPDTPLFDKGRILFNLDQAGSIARRSGRLVVVEGYMDVIGLAQAGVAEAVAPLGTALTEHQLQLLWRVTAEPILCFDGDRAGNDAAVRAAMRALPLLEPGRSLRFCTLPAGQDPDDIVRQQGRGAFEALLERAEPLIDRLWRSEIDGADLRTPERRAAAKNALREHVRAIGHEDVRRLYAGEFQARFDRLFSARRDARPTTRPVMTTARPADIEAAALIAAALRTPALVDHHIEQLAQLPTTDRQAEALLQAMLAVAGEGDTEELATRLRARGLGGAIDQVTAGAGRLADVATRWFPDLLTNVIERRRIDADLEAATARLAANGSEEDFEAQCSLSRERERLSAQLRGLTASIAA